MTQLKTRSLDRDQWERACLAALLAKSADLDRDEAMKLVHAAWTIERFRTQTPAVAAEALLANNAVQPSRRPTAAAKASANA